MRPFRKIRETMEILKEQQNASISDCYECQPCREPIYDLVIGNKIWIVEKIDEQIYATDAHGNLLKINPNLKPFYSHHSCKNI